MHRSGAGGISRVKTKKLERLLRSVSSVICDGIDRKKKRYAEEIDSG